MGDLAQRLANVSGHQALVPRRSLPAIAAAARVAACLGRGRATTAARRRGPLGAMACAARSVAVNLPQQKLHIFFVASRRPRGGRRPYREIKCGPAAADGRSDTAGDLRYRATPERGGKTPHGAGPPAAHSSLTSYARKKRGPFDPMKAASDMAGITQIVLDALRAEMGADGSGAPAGGSRRGASSDGAAEFVEFARQGDGPQVARRGKPPAELRFARRGWRSNSSIRSALPDDGLARSGGSRALPRPRQLLRTLCQSMEERRDAAEQLDLSAI